MPNETKAQTRWPLVIIAVVLLVIAAGAIYWFFVAAPTDDIGANGSVPMPVFNTKFETSILDDVRLRSLKQFGSTEVQVQERGTKANPFQPF